MEYSPGQRPGDEEEPPTLPPLPPPKAAGEGGGEVSVLFPGRCPGLYYLALSGQTTHF